MKKLFFSAAIVVAFSLTSFAAENKLVKVPSYSTMSNSIIVNQLNYSDASAIIFDGTCTVYVTQYNSEGEVTGTRIHTLPATSQADCEKTANQIKTLYEIGALTM
ncbi:hypothetical protein H8R23_01905 [Flavobacterium sp. F-380]|uniref:Uncharacterized protein n=1 Tax=Flavobacterium kayseriense TaxID=2764714 RepID=A0ABR7J3Q7_9FLAO|nr:hypothetical protein [Flavobacterium kayseriense]MBC5840145.1 hypothetical protein [Flavobacterium kayseriense]MBC5847185.1 hypothetical protein [Flavobacterium kayseriense]